MGIREKLGGAAIRRSIMCGSGASSYLQENEEGGHQEGLGEVREKSRCPALQRKMPIIANVTIIVPAVAARSAYLKDCMADELSGPTEELGCQSHLEEQQSRNAQS